MSEITNQLKNSVQKKSAKDRKSLAKISVFENAEFGRVRTAVIDGEPFFVGKDVASILGYAKPENAIAAHVDDEDKTTTLIQGTGSNYKSNAVLINESGLYSLILSSKLPDARKFKRWVTSEVLKALKEYQVKKAVPNAVKDKGTSMVENEKLMTTRELAETLGVDVKTIQRVSGKLFDINVVKSVSTGGRPTQVFNEAQATAIKLELQNHSKIAQNGFNTLTINNDVEMLLLQKRLTEYQDRRIAELTQIVEQQKPKVEYFDNYCDASNLEEIGHLGKALKIGEQKIFKRLVADGYIKRRFSTDGVNCYDPCYGYEKYFEAIHVPFLRGDKKLSRDKLMLTHMGFRYFREKYSNFGGKK